DSALEEIDRLDHLAVSLLVLARSRAAGPPPETPFAVADVARRAVTIATAGGAGAGSSIVPTVDGAGTALGDAESIERAIRNVVENALRYARHAVAIEIEDDADQVVVLVRDDGPGFPPAWLEHGGGRFSPGDSPEAQ